MNSCTRLTLIVYITFIVIGNTLWASTLINEDAHLIKQAQRVSIDLFEPFILKLNFKPIGPSKVIIENIDHSILLQNMQVQAHDFFKKLAKNVDAWNERHELVSVLIPGMTLLIKKIPQIIAEKNLKPPVQKSHEIYHKEHLIFKLKHFIKFLEDDNYSVKILCEKMIKIDNDIFYYCEKNYYKFVHTAMSKQQHNSSCENCCKKGIVSDKSDGHNILLCWICGHQQREILLEETTDPNI